MSWPSPAARATWTRRCGVQEARRPLGRGSDAVSKAWIHVHLEAIEGADEVFDEALAAASRIDDDLVVAMVLANVAEQGDPPRRRGGAATLITESVTRYRRLRAAYPASYTVEAAAHLATRRGARHATRCVSSQPLRELRASIDVPIWTPARDRHERLIASLREQLDPRSVRRGVAFGRGARLPGHARSGHRDARSRARPSGGVAVGL